MDMSSAKPTVEAEELSTSVLEIIDAYRMGAALDTKDLFPRRTAPEAPPPEHAFVPAGGDVSAGV